MKAKLEYCLRWLREGAVRVVRSYPVETLLALYACIRCLLTYELDWSEEELFNRLGLVPLFFALALAVNNLAGRGPWRKVYWVVWAPIVPRLMNILGYPLDRAAAILERAGYRVETVEARSRKGVEGDSKRVVRCLPLPGRSIPTVQLVFCEFKTNVDSLRAEDAADAESTH